VLAGIFVTDPGLGYPPGAREVTSTLSNTIHRIVSLVAFVVLGVAALIVAVGSWASMRRWAVYSLVSGAVELLFFAATVAIATQQEIMVTGGAPTGILQRISIVSGFAWLSALHGRLLLRREAS
jgi:hypothetical protein